ncbi:MAG: hypothetical protein JWQ59_2188 [Cryobacterium sp.]|nr:hypothetical protein [Cryobacterium sp.]
MKGKILFVAGTALGYVLGSKAGRQAYEQIRGKAQDLWGDPHVQKAVSQAGQAAKDAANVAQSKISEKLDHAANTVSNAADEAASGDGAGSPTAASMSTTTGTTTDSSTAADTASSMPTGTWTDVSEESLTEVQDADVETKQDEWPGTSGTTGTSPAGTPNLA